MWTRPNRVLPALVLYPPPLPVGTITMPELCRWLTAATGVTHGVTGELRDYPVFLSFKSPEPKRIEALVATALGGQWDRDGKTLQLSVVRPKPEEGLAEFERGYRAAVDPKSVLASIPPREIYSLKAGRIVRFGYPESPYVRPLPPDAKAKVLASEARVGHVYLRRFANGCFETKVEMPSESRQIFSGDSQIEFRSLPPEITKLLGEEAKKPALDGAARERLQKLTSDPTAAKIDPKTIDRVDPLAAFADPLLGPVAAVLKEDMVVALPDFSIMAMMGGDLSTVGSILKGFSQVIDWTSAEGALVGRLPVSERLNRAQTRRSVLGGFIQSARAAGVPSPLALANYLGAQRPQASESWSDVMMLVMSGLVIDESHLGDHPFNLRFGAALNGRDWDLLRTGRPVTVADLSPAARTALIDVLAQSRERMGGKRPDPALWQGFPSTRLVLTAKVEDEAVLIGRRSGMDNVMKASEAGFGYERLKSELNREPLYKPAHRRKLTLTISRVGSTESVETGFGEVTLATGAKPVAWRELPPAMAKEFEDALRLRQGETP